MGSVFYQPSVSNLPVMEQPLEGEENRIHVVENRRLLVCDIPIPRKPGRLCFPVELVTHIDTIADVGQMRGLVIQRFDKRYPLGLRNHVLHDIQKGFLLSFSLTTTVFDIAKGLLLRFARRHFNGFIDLRWG